MSNDLKGNKSNFSIRSLLNRWRRSRCLSNGMILVLYRKSFMPDLITWLMRFASMSRHTFSNIVTNSNAWTEIWLACYVFWHYNAESEWRRAFRFLRQAMAVWLGKGLQYSCRCGSFYCVISCCFHLHRNFTDRPSLLWEGLNTAV